MFGPNGSGKTTLLRILAGLSKATKGKIEIGRFSYEKHTRALRERIGVVGHHTYLYDDLTAEENLVFYARMFGLERPEESAGDALERVGVYQRRRERGRNLSRGMRQRVSLARATIHDPDILILDEPDTGLDQDACNRIDDFLALSRRLRTMVVATHNLSLGLRLCEGHLILDKGHVAHQDMAPKVTRGTRATLPICYRTLIKPR